jgi:hypothetical protein
VVAACVLPGAKPPTRLEKLPFFVLTTTTTKRTDQPGILAAPPRALITPRASASLRLCVRKEGATIPFPFLHYLPPAAIPTASAYVA